MIRDDRGGAALAPAKAMAAGLDTIHRLLREPADAVLYQLEPARQAESKSSSTAVTRRRHVLDLDDLLVVLDFDGTVTTTNAVDLLAEHWSEDRSRAAARLRDRGIISAAEALEWQLRPVRFSEAEALRFLMAHSAMRPGLSEFVERCKGRGWEVSVVSDGVASYIERFLVESGVTLPSFAHEVRFLPTGAEVAREHLPRCKACGAPCKRPRLESVAAGRRVVYVGDAASDLCVATFAHLVIARGGLARRLAATGASPVEFRDFHDVARIVSGLLESDGRDVQSGLPRPGCDSHQGRPIGTCADCQRANKRRLRAHTDASIAARVAWTRTRSSRHGAGA